jgi:hypothetical protein
MIIQLKSATLFRLDSAHESVVQFVQNDLQNFASPHIDQFDKKSDATETKKEEVSFKNKEII